MLSITQLIGLLENGNTKKLMPNRNLRKFLRMSSLIRLFKMKWQLVQLRVKFKEWMKLLRI
jgi:hypothetical protein